MRIMEALDLERPGVVVGRHAIWLPAEGIKFPFQCGGRIAKYSRPNEPTYPLDSLAHEVAILRALAAGGMAPPVGGWVYAKTVISQYGGARRIDPCGAYGYAIADACELPPGRFDLDAMRALPIAGSPGAWGDVEKPGNVINGYLVDVRRTAWDMLRWTGHLPELPRYREDPVALEARVRRFGAFPPGERPEPYQDFLLAEGGGGAARWVLGARRVYERARTMGFRPAPGDSVLDVGCHTGGFLQWSWSAQRTADGESGTVGAHAGIDIDAAYIACARDLARAAGQNIHYEQSDVTGAAARFVLLAWAQAYFAPRGLDHLLLLSMDKHIGEGALWTLVDGCAARHTYLETNAQREGVYALRDELERRGGQYVGDSTDRNVRRLYRIDRP